MKPKKTFIKCIGIHTDLICILLYAWQTISTTSTVQFSSIGLLTTTLDTPPLQTVKNTQFIDILIIHSLVPVVEKGTKVNKRYNSNLMGHLMDMSEVEIFVSRGVSDVLFGRIRVDPTMQLDSTLLLFLGGAFYGHSGCWALADRSSRPRMSSDLWVRSVVIAVTAGLAQLEVILYTWKEGRTVCFDGTIFQVFATSSSSLAVVI